VWYSCCAIADGGAGSADELTSRLMKIFFLSGIDLQVYILEKVLKIKKDTASGIIFLDEVMKLLENKPSTMFWCALSKSLEKHARDAARSKLAGST